MKADDKNITLKTGEVAKIGDRVFETITNPDNTLKQRQGVVLAVNAETAKENVRVLFDDAIIGLPAMNAGNLSAVQSETGTSVVSPVVNEAGLRTDGPTLPEFIEAGYLAENYPPKGYTDKRTDAELAEALKAKNALAPDGAAK